VARVLFITRPEVTVDRTDRSRALDLVERRAQGGASTRGPHRRGRRPLLQCAMRCVPIIRELDQPGQEHWFAFERVSRSVLHGWRRLESHN
jgi:hypothetical protein